MAGQEVDEQKPEGDPNAEVNEANEQFEQEWTRQCQSLIQNKNSNASQYRQRLQHFLKHANLRDSAQNQLERAYEIFQKSLDDHLQTVLKIAVPVHANLFETVVKMEAEIIETFAQNHEARTALVHWLRNVNEKWEQQYQRFLDRIIATHSDPSRSNNMESHEVQNKQNDSQGKENATFENVDTSKEEDEEPDWEAIVEVDPTSSERVEKFLQSRQMWQAQCQKFSTSLDEIHDELQNSHSRMLTVIAESIGILSDEMDESYDQIRELMMSNFQQREVLDQQLDLVLRQQQNLFAWLRARIGGNPSTISSLDESSSGNSSFSNPLANFFGRQQK